MRKGKILITDDEKDIRELLSDFLQNEGYECRQAANAFEALEIFKSAPDFDLLMSDIRMPGKTGLDLLEEVKKLDEDAMVIMISAVKDIESAIAAMSKGAYDYVAKPFKLNEVLFVANKAMEKRQLVRENKEYQKQLEKMVEERTSELKQAVIELDRTYTFTLRAMVTALDTRDTETQGHSLRVVRFTLKLAELLGIYDKNTLKIYEYGALLHDIGKIGIPDAILRKPGKLDAGEWEIMKGHPRIGYNILERIKFLEEAAQVVLHHHEAYDGSGYPEGLSGENIPLGARIFHIADSIDAMTSDRPYKKALAFDTAAAELLKYSGQQFDPAIISVFAKTSLDFWIAEKASIEENIRREREVS
ncbi:MAG: response regulator [Acidobacteria bacterium]|jgi:putative nucleotidyltransferase with HDIG domain|nr:response regulator [Acidobacteriota bacterium]MCU0275540.1 response regulator [Acidobacteriota bacterium]